MTQAEFHSYGSQRLRLDSRSVDVAGTMLPSLAPALPVAQLGGSERIEEMLQVREARLRELQVRVTSKPGDLRTKNADFETNSLNYFFVIEKRGMHPAKVRACLAEASNGILKLRDLSNRQK